MIKTMKTLALAATLALGAASAAGAATTFKWSYQTSAGTLSGRLTGTLQGDNNTIAVESLVNNAIYFDGVSDGDLPVLLTANAFYDVDYNGRAPAVTLDGAFVDFMACTDISCLTGVVFDPDTIAFFEPVVVTLGWGDVNETFQASNWSISAVPEPQTWALMIAGFGLAGASLRRRRAVAA